MIVATVIAFVYTYRQPKVYQATCQVIIEPMAPQVLPGSKDVVELGTGSFWANKEFVGPAAIVNAHRFIFDSRDEGAEERLAVLNTRNGVWRCRTVFNCTDACPRDIEITRAIEDVKRTLLFGKT